LSLRQFFPAKTPILPAKSASPKARLVRSFHWLDSSWTDNRTKVV
jgi:hypothetical protein